MACYNNLMWLHNQCGFYYPAGLLPRSHKSDRVDVAWQAVQFHPCCWLSSQTVTMSGFTNLTDRANVASQPAWVQLSHRLPIQQYSPTVRVIKPQKQCCQCALAWTTGTNYSCDGCLWDVQGQIVDNSCVRPWWVCEWHILECDLTCRFLCRHQTTCKAWDTNVF